MPSQLKVTIYPTRLPIRKKSSTFFPSHQYQSLLEHINVQHEDLHRRRPHIAAAGLTFIQAAPASQPDPRAEADPFIFGTIKVVQPPPAIVPYPHVISSRYPPSVWKRSADPKGKTDLFDGVASFNFDKFIGPMQYCVGNFRTCTWKNFD